jgi:hypothetical protein
MGTECFKSKVDSTYVAVLGVITLVYLGYLQNGAYSLNAVTFEAAGVAGGLILFIYLSKRYTFLEIRESRSLVNSGYKLFRRDEIDIFDIKYIYRYPHLSG